MRLRSAGRVCLCSMANAGAPLWRTALGEAKQVLLGSSASSRLHVSVGNMAGDVDSIVSAIGMARLNKGVA